MTAEALRSPLSFADRLTRRRGDRSRFRSAAVVLFLPTLLLSLYWVDATWAIPPFANLPYAPALSTEANSSIVIVAPYVAVAAAWEMGALRTVWGRLVVKRSWGQVVLGRLGLVVGCGVAAIALAYALVGGTTFLRHAPDPGLLVVSVVSVTAWTAFGAALALVFRSLVALPLALIAPFLVLSLPQGWEPLWVRHVNGYVSDCCRTSEVLDYRAVQASLAFLLALLMCAGAVIAVRLAQSATQARRVAWVGAVGAGVALAVAAAAIAPVTQLGAVPTVQRPLALLQCSGELCLWPEDAPARVANETAWSNVKGIWTGLGLPLPTTRISPVVGPGVIAVATSSSDVEQATVSIATLLPRQLTGCPDDYSQPSRDEALSRLGYLVLSLAAPEAAAQTPLPDGYVPRQAEASALWAASGRCP